MVTTNRFQQIFFELYEGLPRQGPGNRASAARALGLCRNLPRQPSVLDLGCGAGGQTLHLAELLISGSIVALDSHAPLIERLRRRLVGSPLAQRVHPLIGDMAHPALAPGSFDLIWSEGALYNIGIRDALEVCRSLLRPGGCVAFTDAVWRKPDPPAEVRALFDADYPGMGCARDIVDVIARSGFELLGQFTLPDEAWWDDFYAPMELRIAAMENTYAGDEDALAALAELKREPELHRRYSDYYAYEFFVVTCTRL